MPETSILRVPPPLTLQLLDTAIPILRLTQSLSACTFSVFSIIHLSAPLTALLPSKPKYIRSPENRANGFLLIGRELYQGDWTEPLFLYGGLGLHVVSGVLNRGLKLWQRIERRKWKRELLKIEMKNLTSEEQGSPLPSLDEGEKEMLIEELKDLDVENVPLPTTSPGSPEEAVAEAEIVAPSGSSSTSTVPPLTTHQATGYVLIPIVFHHLYLHRILPSSPLPPISSLSPSFFNYSFTSFSINHPSLYLKTASTLSYAALASLAAYHALVGLRILYDPTAPRSLQPKRPRVGPPSRRRKLTKGKEWQGVWTSLVLALGIGTARIAGKFGGERLGDTPEWIVKKMDYVLKSAWGSRTHF